MQALTLTMSPDTDIFVMCLTVSEQIQDNLCMKTGTKIFKHIININGVKQFISDSINKTDCSTRTFMDALVGLHSFSRCDTISAFTGKGKLKPLAIMSKDEQHIQTFARLGTSWSTDGLVDNVEEFVCHSLWQQDRRH